MTVQVKCVTMMSPMTYLEMKEGKESQKREWDFLSSPSHPAGLHLALLVFYHLTLCNLLSVPTSAPPLSQTVFRIVVLGIWDYIENKVEVSSHESH